MKNDNGNKIRRRKVALANREVQLKSWLGSLTGDISFVLKRKPATGDQKTFVEAKIALAQSEITTLKSRIGIIHHG